MVTTSRSSCSSRYRVSSDIPQLVIGLLRKKISSVEIFKKEEDRRIPGWRPIPRFWDIIENNYLYGPKWLIRSDYMP